MCVPTVPFQNIFHYSCCFSRELCLTHNYQCVGICLVYIMAAVTTAAVDDQSRIFFFSLSNYNSLIYAIFYIYKQYITKVKNRGGIVLQCIYTHIYIFDCFLISVTVCLITFNSYCLLRRKYNFVFRYILSVVTYAQDSNIT
jgi:hypothetical protein